MQERTPRYIQIARGIEKQIGQGALRVGDRVSSIRGVSHQQGVSISTVLQAYLWLESRGFIESRPQSGFYVRVPYANLVPEPGVHECAVSPKEVIGMNNTVDEILRSQKLASKTIPLGSVCLDPRLLPMTKLNRIMRGILNRYPLHSSVYEFGAGAESLRRQIARRSLDYGCNFAPAEILVTNGGMEAINLALRAVARPGDVIAVESPTAFGLLQAIEVQEMRAIEIPTDPRSGMKLEFLEHAIKRHNVKACLVMTNCHNPLGYIVAEEQKKALAELTGRQGIPIIEDDVFADLAFTGPRPKPVKAFDREGLVLLCSSFSKVLCPGYRLGWIQAGRFQRAVQQLKFVTSVAAPSLPQLVVAEFLASGAFERYRRRLRTALAAQMHQVTLAVAKYFPPGTRLTRPAGGFLLWVELSRRKNALKIHQQALARGISIVPGIIFSPNGQYKHHLRISCSHTWSAESDKALLELGQLCMLN